MTEEQRFESFVPGFNPGVPPCNRKRPPEEVTREMDEAAAAVANTVPKKPRVIGTSMGSTTGATTSPTTSPTGSPNKRRSGGAGVGSNKVTPCKVTPCPPAQQPGSPDEGPNGGAGAGVVNTQGSSTGNKASKEPHKGSHGGAGVGHIPGAAVVKDHHQSERRRGF
jgi:hypothetical protein